MKKVQIKNKLKGFFGLFAAFAMAIGVGVSLAPKDVVKTEAASPYTYTFTAKVFDAYDQTKKLGDYDWHVTRTAATSSDYLGTDGTKGQQFGSKNDYVSKLNLTTSGISGTITEVEISTSGAASVTATVGVKVGASSFLTGGAATKAITATNTAYTFTGSASGSVDIEWNNTSKKAIYLKTIKVTYTEGGGGQPDPDPATSVVVSAAGGATSLKATQTLQLSASVLPNPGAIQTVTWSSLDVSKATVNATTGLVTGVAVGNVTIRATSTTPGIHGDIQLSVTAAPVLASFTKITSIADLHVGSTYIIANSAATFVLSETQNGNNRGQISATPTGGVYVEVSGMQKFTLETGHSSRPGTFAFKSDGGDQNGKYLYTVSGKNYLRSEATLSEASSWKISFEGENSNAVLKTEVHDRTLRHNSDNNIFAGYGTGQNPIDLYVDESTVPESGFGTLDHISVNTVTAKTTYYAGEKFTSDGLVVTAFDTKPEPESKVVVSYTVSIAEETVLSTLGEHTVTVTYIEGVSKSTTYKINVLRAQTYTKLATADEIRFGQIYALGSADGAASTSVATYTGEVAVNYNEADDSFTTVANLQLVALRIGAVKGSYAIQLLNGPSVDKYYSWTTGNEIRVSSEINEASSWFIAFDEEVLTITHAVEPTRFIGHNHGSNRFAAYTGTTTPAAFLYMDFGSYEVEQEAMTLAEAVNTGIGEGAKGSCNAAYEFLSDVYSRLSVGGKAFFDVDEDYVDINTARERMLYLAAWTAANAGTPDAKVSSPVNGDNSLTATIIIGVIGLTTLAGYYFLQKKKEA